MHILRCCMGHCGGEMRTKKLVLLIPSRKIRHGIAPASVLDTLKVESCRMLLMYASPLCHLCCKTEDDVDTGGEM